MMHKKLCKIVDIYLIRANSHIRKGKDFSGLNGF